MALPLSYGTGSSSLCLRRRSRFVSTELTGANWNDGMNAMHVASHTGPANSIKNDADEFWCTPKQNALDQSLPWLMFVVCLAYLWVFRRYSTLEPDEGIVLQGAERILGGQLPYRDFFSFYTPGSFYLVAWLFRIFGDSFTIARMSVAV